MSQINSTYSRYSTYSSCATDNISTDDTTTKSTELASKQLKPLKHSRPLKNQISDISQTDTRINDIFSSKSLKRNVSAPSFSTSSDNSTSAFSSVITKADTTVSKKTTRESELMKRDYALSLPIYQTINNPVTAKNIFPHMYQKHGRFLNFSATKSLKLLDTASTNSALSRSIMKQYLRDKEEFKSIQEFAIFKLNELETATKNGTKIPTKIRTSIACDLFEEIMNTAQHSSPLIDRLKLELYRSIYGQNQELVNERTIKTQGRKLPPKLSISTETFFKLEPFFHQLERVTTYFNSQKRHAGRISQLKETHSFDGSGKRTASRLSSDGNTSNLSRESRKVPSTNNIFISDADITTMQMHFFAWKNQSVTESRAKAKLRNKLKISVKKHVYKSRRMHFLAWKDHVWRTKLNMYQINEFKLNKKLQESQRAAIILLKKSSIAEQQISRIRQLRTASDMDTQQILEKKMLKLELSFLNEKLQQARRKLVSIQSDRNLVHSEILLTAFERRNRITLDKLLCEDMVLRWVSHHLKTMPKISKAFTKPLPTKVTNFTHDFASGTALLLLMHKLKEQANIDLERLSLTFQPSKRRQVIEFLTEEMSQFVDYEGLYTFNDLFQNRPDVIFMFLVNVMQNYPLLSINDANNVRVKDIFSQIDLRLIKLSTASSDEIGSLRQTVIDSEAILNRTNSFIETLHKSHENWLKAITKCQKKALACFAARRFGESVYIKSEAESKQAWQNPNRLTYFSHLKIKSLIRKNRHLKETDSTPLTPHFNGSNYATDRYEDTFATHDEYSIAEISQILGTQIKSTISAKEKRRLINDILTIKECESVIEQYFHFIESCFKFYSASDFKVSSLTIDEVKLLLKETKLYDNVLINDKFLMKAFRLCDMSVQKFASKYDNDGYDQNASKLNQRHPNLHPSELVINGNASASPSPRDSGNSTVDSSDDMSVSHGPAAKRSLNKSNISSKLTMFEFIEFLLRLACKRFQAKSISIADKLRMLITMHIARYSASGDELRDQMEHPQIKKLLRDTLGSQLYEAFVTFSDGVKNPKNVKKNTKTLTKQSNKQTNEFGHNKEDETNPGIDFDSFCGMLDELQLISSNFTRATFKTIFKRATFTNDDSSKFRHNKKNKGDTLQFNAFLECLVVLAIYKKPDPYLPLPTRLEEFLVQSVVNPLHSKNKISKGASLSGDMQ